MRRTWIVVMGGLALLALGQWLRLGPRGSEASAEESFRRGNDAFHEACRSEGAADARLLGQAIEDYRACLEHETNHAGDSQLFDDARHNLELAKLHLAGDGAPPKQTSPKNQPDGSSQRKLAASRGHDASPDGSAGPVRKRTPTRVTRDDALANFTPEGGTSKPPPPKPRKMSSCPT
jgi:hypothetical protein